MTRGHSSRAGHGEDTTQALGVRRVEEAPHQQDGGQVPAQGGQAQEVPSIKEAP
jgi:hypothetical protein